MNRKKVFLVSVTLMLLVTGLATVGPSTAGAAGAKVKADGIFTTVIGPSFADWTLGNLVILTRNAVSTYTGSLEGTTVTQQTVTRDDVVAHKAYQTNPGTFWGT